ncbi:uncharacterized protein Dwil_GK17244 [Drosophila willistoni]|uniref:Chitin-binding type-2 domain-containing protein n=1 Tax=Drosophila willistoni TaxID=7260 RepID=B4MKW0_DROWI|nr:peritrophin-48 [Drosophila willistoni]EDW72885.1 uncharacterized protein Dwil_GK17244 [Drosophila willistoni]
MLGGSRNTICLVVLGLVLCGCTAPAAANVNMSALCLMVTDGLYVASETDCSSYYLCEGAVATLQTCGSGQYFDKNTQLCNTASQVSCSIGSSATPCAGKAVGTFAPTNNSCTDYYYCGASGAQRSSCPNGENFNPNTMSCVWPSQYPCTTVTASDGVSAVSLNLCQMIKDGVYFGSSDSCTAWNYCNNNTLVTGTCPNSMDFNVAKGICDYAVDTTCSQVTYDQSLSTTGAGKCGTVGETKNATACNQFYLCQSSGVYTLQTCSQSGYYYDTISKICVPRMSARNQCDRCVGTTKTFVNAYSATSCSDYLYCVNGVQRGAEQQCPSGYYFNEDMGDCVIVDPDYACCTPSNATSSTTTS